MNIDALQSKLEAILFASGDPLPLERLCAVLDCTRQEAEEGLSSLGEGYLAENRGIRLLKLGDQYQLVSDPAAADVVRMALETRRASGLSQAALEVLAIVAYSQPVTRVYIEQIRGVDSAGTVQKLAEKGLIEECGKLDVPGKPTLFRTTPLFLRTFGLSDLKELPNLSEVDGEEGEQLSLLLS